MEWMFLLIVVLVVVALILKNVSNGRTEKEQSPYEQQLALLTPAERSFYGVLMQVVGPESIVFSKVRVADILKPISGMDRSSWQTAFNKISAKHFDFVLCDSKTLAIKMVLELDDSSHQKKARVSRDAFLDSACKSAKLDLKRIKTQRAYKVDDVRSQLFGDSVGESISVAPVLERLRPEIAPNFQVFDLHMSQEGFVKVSSELKEAHRRTPQIYVHVGVEGGLKNQVLRIGRAKNGTYNRWMQTGNGHKNTFFWSIGVSDHYGQKNAEAYSNYLLFFAALFNQKTKLYVIDVKEEEMSDKEVELINEYNPIWEQYKSLLKSSKHYPTLTGKNRDLTIANAVAKLGAARQLIFAQRKLSDGSAKKLPDIVSLEIRSEKEWSQ